MHVKSQLIGAQLENKATSPTPTSVGLLYWDTVFLHGYVHNGTAWERIISTSDGALQLDEVVSTPSTPPVGTDKLYFKSDDNLYRLNALGVETLIASTQPGAVFDRQSTGDVTVSDLTTRLHPRLIVMPGDDYAVDSGGELECPTSCTVSVGATLFVATGGTMRVY